MAILLLCYMYLLSQDLYAFRCDKIHIDLVKLQGCDRKSPAASECDPGSGRDQLQPLTSPITKEAHDDTHLSHCGLY